MMGLLTPLYIAGLAAISLPLFFHLIRRTPRGQQVFSSLMFLAPSPPRITRRSRLDNVLLFLLRAGALILLALAFARPFFRSTGFFDVAGMRGRQLVLMVDNSASMQRDGIWTDAMKQADQWANQLRPSDRVAVFTFAAARQCLLGFEEQKQLLDTDIRAIVKSRLRTIQPSWSISDVGGALMQAADMLNELDQQQQPPRDTAREIVLISDLQEGSQLNALQSYEWPPGVQLHVHRIDAARSTNASLQVITDSQETAPEPMSPRVRVTNAPDSLAEQFQLQWARGDERLDADPIDAYVPPGKSLVFRVPIPTQAVPDRLILTGDDHDFDNTYYTAVVKTEMARVTYLGADSATDRQGPRYFLELAFSASSDREIVVRSPEPGEPLVPDPEETPHLVVITEDPPIDRLNQLERYLGSGGTVLYLLTSGSSGDALRRLMQRQTLRVEEAKLEDYALLGEIRFTHPLFAIFSNPRYNDFTGIRFRHYRRVDLAADAPDNPTGQDAPVLVLARFDSGDPALFHQAVNEGNLYALTSGWHPADSQFARSSKFVSLLLNLLQQHLPRPMKSQSRVDEPVLLPEANSQAPRMIRKPDGTQDELTQDQSIYREADQPGVYRLNQRDSGITFAVNLPAAESKTAPLDIEDLEQFGVRLGSEPTQEEAAARQRQLLGMELESQQKLWQFLVMAAILLLLAETWLAGRLSKTEPTTVAG